MIPRSVSRWGRLTLAAAFPALFLLAAPRGARAEQAADGPAFRVAGVARSASEDAATLAVTTASADTVWTPALSMRYRRIGGPTMSRDGRLVAYVVVAADMKGTESRYDSRPALGSLP